MGFIKGVFGFQIDDVLISRRISGFSAEQTSRLGLRRQAPVLSFWALRALEHKLVDEDANDDE
eukprot:6509325-Karenia_brevis.AAC.1